jgi:hypothetical protein
MATLNNLKTVLAAAMITCGAVLMATWPTDTQADDVQSAAAQDNIGVDTTKVGALNATTRLVQDSKVKGKWYMEIKVENTSSEGRQTAEINEEVQKMVYTASMGRSGPIPTVAYKVHEKVDVLPNETATVRHPLPAWLGTQISNSLKPPKMDKEGNVVMQSTTSFATTVSSRT